MDVRKAADMLCKSYASLSLSTTSSRTAITRRPLNQWTCQSCRRISSHVPRRQPAAAAAAAATRSSDNEPQYNHDMYRSRDTGFLPPRNTAESSDPGLQGRQTRRTRTPGPQRNTSETKSSSEPKSSVDDLIQAGREATLRARGRLGGSIANRYSSDLLNYPETMDTEVVKPAPRPRVLSELDVHVKPRTGRSLSVDPQSPTALGVKLRMLDTLVKKNGIKSAYHSQRFHERPGLKRKRLARERWRANFKSRFTGVLARVNNLRVQGW